MSLANSGFVEAYMMRKLLKEKMMKESLVVEEARDAETKVVVIPNHQNQRNKNSSNNGCLFGMLKKKIHPASTRVPAMNS
ncbi:hypothetical protein HYC85_008235 [Camellia sinensis]|uniref:Uncharacterized protein n=1 Tax=Camellia sinensis TaxID=4442 RepID=A0A7J7HRY7_CAMSI|nr:hypothetical protein HYC85_008235 [Camellia sinensis]